MGRATGPQTRKTRRQGRSWALDAFRNVSRSDCRKKKKNSQNTTCQLFYPSRVRGHRHWTPSGRRTRLEDAFPFMTSLKCRLVFLSFMLFAKSSWITKSFENFTKKLDVEGFWGAEFSIFAPQLSNQTQTTARRTRAIKNYEPRGRWTHFSSSKQAPTNRV